LTVTNRSKRNGAADKIFHLIVADIFQKKPPNMKLATPFSVPKLFDGAINLPTSTSVFKVNL